MKTMNLAVAMLLVVVSAPGVAEIEIKHIDPPTLNKHPAYAQVTTVRGSMRLIFIAGQVERGRLSSG